MASRIIIITSAVIFGALYSIGYASERIRYTLEDHVPMYPAALGIAVLFIIGATVGILVACLFMPKRVLKSESSRRFMQEAFGSDSPAVLRASASLGLAFMLFVTYVVLYWAFVSMQD